MVTYHPVILYLREQEREDPWLFFEATTGPLAKMFAKHCFWIFMRATQTTEFLYRGRKHRELCVVATFVIANWHRCLKITLTIPMAEALLYLRSLVKYCEY